MPERGRVVLLGWDAADWALIHPLLDAGLMPNLRSLVERGVIGKLETLQPALSPLLWTSVATGKTADKHGIFGFLEPDPVGGKARVVSSTSRRAKALWNILHESGKRSLVLNWFASQPAEAIDGVTVSNLYCKTTAPYHTPWRIVPGSIHPPALEEKLADLRVHAGELTVEDLRPFIPNLPAIDQKADHRPLQLGTILAEAFTVHAATTWLMENEPWDFLAVYHGAIDLAGHYFMRYRPPRLETVSAQDFTYYKDVIDGVYCFHDLMLGRIVELAGTDATILIVSDHGFESGRFRPATEFGKQDDDPLSWHRSHGILCMAGPGVRADELVHGAGLLDIAPTVLSLFGLPRGADMPGRVLAEAFRDPLSQRQIATWEHDTPNRTDEANREDAWASAAVIEQLAELGYIDPVGEDAKEELRKLENSRNFTLAQVHLGNQKPADAIPLLQQVIDNSPAERRPTAQLYLAQAFFEAGRLQECRVVVEEVLALKPHQAAAHGIRGNLALAEGDLDAALTSLLKAEEGWRDSPRLKQLIGQVYLRAQRWDDAERCFRAVIEFDPDMAAAHAGLARALLEKRRFREAATESLGAVGLKFNLPGSHFVLGVSLARLGDTERAVQAFETCLKLAPDTKEAREWLENLRAVS